ncbi:hypothetical protein F4802DRAFT_615172 [Xylaria palmicola]|nr:hypothetical protein F4802DRAFT_615172 [Xylaria palmicola]
MDNSNSTNSDGYRLGRSYVAATRLNLQHFMYKDSYGFLLHPVIQAYLRQEQEARQTGSQESLHLADLATGTGIWLFDLLNSPEVSGLDFQYRGFDISRALFPHEAWLPKNLVLSTSNLLEEPPKSLHGQFDVVHLRLVLSLVGSGSPKPIIQHIKMLLSGYLQWDELDPFNHYDVLMPTPESTAPNMLATFQHVKNLADWSWIAKLPQTLLEEGFQEAVQHSHEPRPELLKTWTHLDLCSCEERSLHWKGADGDDCEEWRQLIPKAYEEATEDNGAVIRVRPTITIARKPL